MRRWFPKLLIYASGTKTGGGSGFENLVVHSRGGDLDAEIVGVVSNYERGGVRERADRLGVPFIYFPGPYTAENYQRLVSKAMGGSSSTTPLGFSKTEYRQENLGAEPAPLEGEASLMGWIALSGWLKVVRGLDPAKTFNIHPALLSFDHGRFGGPGMYGHHIHEAVAKALEAGEISESGVTMHFVSEEYDCGPIFFEYRVPLEKGMAADDIARAVNKIEHEWQPKITNMIVYGDIRWDGKDSKSLAVPEGYTFLPPVDPC